MKIEMENIGGISEVKLKLKKGINYIKGSNAGGKTSFVRGIEAVLLPRKEVEKRPEILNVFENRGRVSIDDYNRYFTRNGKFTCVGDQYDISGEAITAYNIGWQDNELFKKIVNRENLAPFFEKYSDIKVYDYMLKGLNVEKDEKERLLEVFRKEVASLEQARKIKTTANQKIKELEKEHKEVKKQITPELLHSNAEIQEKLAPIRDKRKEVDRIYTDRKARIKDLEEEIKNLEVAISEFSKLYHAFIKIHPNPDQELTDLDADHREHEARFSTVKSARQYVLKRAKELMTEEGKIRETGLCSLCGQPVTEGHIVKELKKLDNEAEELRKELNFIDNEKKYIRQKIDSLQREYNKFRETQKERRRQQEKTLANRKNELSIYSKGRKPKRGETLSIDDWGIDKLENHLRKLSREIETLEEQLQTELAVLERKRDKISREVGKKEDEVARSDEKIKRYEGVGDKAQQTLEDVEWLKKEIGWWQTGKAILRSSVINNFKDKIDEIIKELNYEFKEIILDQHFNLFVKRVKDNMEKAVPVEVLSESERVTIAITMMLAGRVAYTPEFPLFILDKLTLDYDEGRFNALIDYLKNEVDYILVTIPSEGTELSVIYG